ncbi:unnamed protein product [Enterobius vermicularis]|uniref:WSD domain-containing protein n=1 Tax=Enterobius vermicularis TaxID=51028 RepID=A0A158Q9B1_ENTVE|nr:unnamed protein product [Enterobius vermicularis]
MPVADGILWQETPDNAAGKFVPLETVKNSALKGGPDRNLIKYQGVIWKCRHEKNGPLRSFKEAYDEERTALQKIRNRIPNGLLHDILQLVHHSFRTEKNLIEEINHYLLENFYDGENVSFSRHGRQSKGQIIRTLQNGSTSSGKENEKRYDIAVTACSGSDIVRGIPSKDIKRLGALTLDDISTLISLTAYKANGTNFWCLEEPIRMEFKISNKVHSLFTKCRFSSGKSIRSLNGDMISGVTTGNTDAVEGEEKKQLKHESVKKKGDRGLPTVLKKISLTSGLQKSMYKFLVTSPGTSSPSVVIPSPRSAAEKRLDNALLRIVKLFPVPDHKEFQQACEFALNVISESQIREIPYEEIRYALLKHRDHKKDVTASLKMSAAERKAYMLDKRRERLKNYGDEEHKLDSLLSRKLDEQLLPDLRPLPVIPSVEFGAVTPLFGSCLLITEFVNTFHSLLVPRFVPSAGRILWYITMPFKNLILYVRASGSSIKFLGLIDISALIVKASVHDLDKLALLLEQMLIGLKDGAQGVGLVLSLSVAFMNTLLQSTAVNKCTVYGIPVSFVPVTTATVSELVRVVLKSLITRNKDVKDDEGVDDVGAAVLHENNCLQDASVYSGNISLELGSALERLKICGITELTPCQQLEILKGLIDCLQESTVFKSFVEVEVPKQIRKLAAKKEVLEKSVLQLQSELSSLPSFPQDSQLTSRYQTRLEGRCEQERRKIEKRIDLLKEDIDVLSEKEKKYLAFNRKILRLEPLGLDRYNRRYWYFGKSSNGGIFVEKGWWNYSLLSASETNSGALEASEKSAENVEQVVEPLGEGVSLNVCFNGTPRKKKDGKAFEVFEKLYAAETGSPVEEAPESWFKISDAKTLESLMSSLTKKGIRESRLLASIKKISEGFRSSLDTKVREVPVEIAEVGGLPCYKHLHEEIWSFEGELRKRRFTKIIDEDEFLGKIERSCSLPELKTLLLELCDSIPERDLTQKSKHRLGEGKFSLLSWKEFLKQAASVSQLSVLLHLLETQIDWDYSLQNQKCRICNKARSQNEFIVCETCGSVIHFYCVRPRLDEMPPGGIFENMVSLEEEMEVDDYDNSFESENNGDLSGTVSSDSDSCGNIPKDIHKYIETLKSNLDVYELLLRVPAEKSSRCQATLKSIVENLRSYNCEYKLKNDLRLVFKAASAFYQGKKGKMKRIERMRESLNI